MKDRAITYLMKNLLLHMGMIEPIRRGTADILYAETDGVLIKEQKSNAYMEVILEHYDKLSNSEIESLLKSRNLLRGYKNGTLVSFIGNHLEGSIGLLEVFPQYRCLGYGTILESYIVNQMLEKGSVPFAQIETNNEKSMALQNKLGFKISKDRLYWMF